MELDELRLRASLDLDDDATLRHHRARVHVVEEQQAYRLIYLRVRADRQLETV